MNLGIFNININVLCIKFRHTHLFYLCHLCRFRFDISAETLLVRGISGYLFKNMLAYFRSKTVCVTIHPDTSNSAPSVYNVIATLLSA